MTDESAPRGWQIKGPDDVSPQPIPSEPDDDAMGDAPTPPSGTAMPPPAPSREPLTNEQQDYREHADSIAPMSSPIVALESDSNQPNGNAPNAESPNANAPSGSHTIGRDTAGNQPSERPERTSGAPSDPPAAPSVRRLAPPPKPKSATSRPPSDPQIEPEALKRPYFPAPGLPSAPPAPNRSPGLGPFSNGSGVTASPRPSTMPRAARASQTNEKLEPARPSQPPAGESPVGQNATGSPSAFPPAAALPRTGATSSLLSSRPPPTLPTGALPSQYPWMSSATARLFTAGEDDFADRENERLRGNGEAAAEPRHPEPEIDVPKVTQPTAAARGAALPPARHASQPPDESTVVPPSAPRAAVLPRATRDSARRSSTPPPKPRIVPPRSPKEHPTASIQAMRIIAIGSEEGSLSTTPRAGSIEQPPAEEAASNPTSSAPELETAEIGSAPESDAESDADIQSMPALPEAALQDIPPLPEYALEDAPLEPNPIGASPDAPPPDEYRDSVPAMPRRSDPPQAAASDEETAEPLGLELVPLQPGESVGGEAPANRGESQAAARAAAAEAAEEDRAPDSVEILDPDAQPATRKRPPPPRRISMPSSPDGQGTAASSVPAMPAAAAAPVISAPVEGAPRQPPPAPSRVPRDPPPRPNARPAEAKPAEAKPAEAKPAGSTAAPDASEKSKARQRRPWWEELFNEDFYRAITRCTDAQIDQEVVFIEESLGVAPGGALLDLGCGSGHHAVELASRGYGVVGYDLSLYQLALAQEVAQERGQKLNFMQGDMRDMAFEEVFDGIYCWNTTFGYFEEEKNILVAQRMFAALKPGGTLLLDVANRDFVALDQPSSVWFEGDSCVCMDDMSVDFFTSRLRVKRSLILDDGRTRECHYSIRLYSLHELGRILHDVGFRVTEASGHPATPGVFLGQTSPRIIVLAQKP